MAWRCRNDVRPELAINEAKKEKGKRKKEDV
jgi:hypothetical protein